jgi:hypothetical protein
MGYMTMARARKAAKAGRFQLFNSLREPPILQTFCDLYCTVPDGAMIKGAKVVVQMWRFLRASFWAAILGAIFAFALGGTSRCFLSLIAGAVLAWAALAVFGSICLAAPPSRAVFKLIFGVAEPVRDTDPDLVGRLEGSEVHGVFVREGELLLYLRGGTGFYMDRQTKQSRPWPPEGELFFTWRCPRRRSRARLVHQLDIWQATSTRLVLRGARGYCSLIEDEHQWVNLPELSTAGWDRAAHLGKR